MNRVPKVIGAAMLAAIVAMIVSNAIRQPTRPVLAGDRHVDFGIVKVRGKGETLRHTFSLINIGRSPLEFQGVKTSCGCAGARLSTSSIDPGESAEVSVEVTITTAGAKRETIWLLCRDKEPEVLTVSAVGEFAEALFATRDRLRLDEQGKASFVLIAYADTTDEPPVNFTAVSASEVTVAFEGWRMIQPPAPAEHRPGRWHGRVSISALMEPGHFVSTEIKLGAQTVSVWLEAQPTP